jgi:hypothetical protein
MTNAEEPYFSIDSLDAFTSFDSYGDDGLKALVYAVNQKGRSGGVLVKEFLFENSAESRAGIISTSFCQSLLQVTIT